jgi:hypothetical protein
VHRHVRAAHVTVQGRHQVAAQRNSFITHAMHSHHLLLPSSANALLQAKAGIGGRGGMRRTSGTTAAGKKARPGKAVKVLLQSLSSLTST